MNNKIKTFVSSHNLVLEDEVNQWLDLNDDVDCLNIQYQMTFDEENDEMYYSVVIFYQVHKK